LGRGLSVNFVVRRVKRLARCVEAGAAALISGHDYTARADSAWPGGLDLRGLHGALSGVVTCMCGLQDMAAGVDLDGDAFEPLLATLTPWRDRVLAARNILEQE
jgi:hypothetical protein